MVKEMAEKKTKTNVRRLYEEKVVPALQKKFNYKNIMEMPQLKKIVVNMGVGEGISDAKIIEAAVKDLTIITGQAPVVNRARKAIAGFKLREGMPVGCSVTLRGERMYEFFDRLANAAIPRIRDFRGLNARSFDGNGNYAFGVKEQIIFPEINYDKILKVMGMDITIVTSAKTDEEARELLLLLGMPLKKDQ